MPATITAPPAANKTPDKKQPILMVPFSRAAREHIEPFVDETKPITASSQTLGPYDVPAYGYMRGIYVTIDASGGSGSGAVAAEDGPWSVIQEIALLDVNGAPIWLGSGYDLYLANKYGGYGFSTDPRQSPYYSAVAASGGGFSFVLRLPVEISPRDGLGALPNQNAASSYKLRITLGTSSEVYATPPATTLPNVRIRMHLDAWSQPTPTDLRGNANAQTPPAMGTTQYYSKALVNVLSGNQIIRLPRVGNYIRSLIFVNRDTNGSRATGDGYWPDNAVIYWDTRPLTMTPRRLWKHLMQQRTGYTAAEEAAGGLDKGVYVWDLAHDFHGKIGHELRDGWLGTSQTTRLEIQGTWGGASGLTVLTNDVSPAGEVFV